MSLASRLPYDHAYAGGYPGIGSQPLPTDSDCLAYLANVAAADGAGVEVGVAMAVDEFFRDSKAAGVFDALKACCILAGARTLAGALVPVVGDAPTNVADGFVDGDYSRTAGLTGDGATTYLDSGRADNDEPSADHHYSVYHTTDGDAGGLIGVRSDTGAPVFNGTHLYQNSSTQIVRSRSSAIATHSANDGTGTIFSGMSRQSSSGVSYRSSGVTDTVSSLAVTIPPLATNVRVFGRGYDGVTNLFPGTIAFYSIGTSLSLEALDTAVTNLITAIGEAL